MKTELESRLQGTRWGYITAEFITNSAHFPIANMVLELLHEGPSLLLRPDPYVIILAALVQAYFLGSREFAGKPRPFIGNLIGPLIYTVIETAMEGAEFFATGNHRAYILFAVVIGLLQELRIRSTGRAGDAILVAENIVRANIIVVMYWIFEAVDAPKYAPLAGFLSDGSHIFIMLAVTFLGLLLGIANVQARSYLAILRSTAYQLRRYSEWLLGKELLYSAVADPASLAIQRRARSVLFLDVRGFTKWSEAQPPERVVEMLNILFERAEKVWERHNAIKAKFTGDEINAGAAQGGGCRPGGAGDTPGDRRASRSVRAQRGHRHPRRRPGGRAHREPGSEGIRRHRGHGKHGEAHLRQRRRRGSAHLGRGPEGAGEQSSGRAVEADQGQGQDGAAYGLRAAGLGGRRGRPAGALDQELLDLHGGRAVLK